MTNRTDGKNFEILCEERIGKARTSPDAHKDACLFQACLRIARRALADVLRDPTQGATRFHSEDAFPVWAQGRTPAVSFGSHLYYREDA